MSTQGRSHPRLHAKDLGEAFLFYFEKWRGSKSVQRMSFCDRGVYLEMMIEQWLRGSLPDDVELVADALATTPEQVAEVKQAWPTVRKKFAIITTPLEKNTIHPEKHQIQNARLEQVRKARQDWIRQKKRAAAKRWKDSKQDASALRPHSDRNANREEKSREEESREEKKGSRKIKSSVAFATPHAIGFQPTPDQPDDNLSVITKIAHEVIDQLGPASNDLAEAVKSLCAMRRIAYDSRTVGAAIDSARVQRRVLFT